MVLAPELPHQTNQQTSAFPGLAADRKSTRLNSSHRCTSYAVFCVKKQNLRRVCMETRRITGCTLSLPIPLCIAISLSALHCIKLRQPSSILPPREHYSVRLRQWSY